MRELQIQAQVADESLGLDLTGADGETGFSGFPMHEALQKSLKSCKLSPDSAHAPIKTLILCRPGNDTELSFANALAEAGWPVEQGTFDGYLELLATPTTSVLPQKVMDRIMTFANDHFPETGVTPSQPVPSDKPVVRTATFTEEPVRFGTNQRFFGVLCQPVEPRRGPVFIFLNTGYCHHAGWARIYVRAARYLAERGIATFRFDMANIGESPPAASRTEQVLYTDTQFGDTDAAVDYLKSRGLGPLVLVGRCSGAYVGFHTAAANDSVDGVMLINQLRLIWDTEENIFDALNFGARPLEEYRRRAFSLTSVKRLVRGEIDVRRAAGHITNHLTDRLTRRAAPYLGSLTKLGRFRKACHSRFAAMADRGIPVEILNCEVDGSLNELARYFGPDHSGLDAYPNARRSVIKNADHNLTPEPAQVFLLQSLEQMAGDPRLQKT
jgi:pimeloyl-ACP methyl ester carboxylesterase